MPELTKRTRSIDGISLRTRSPSSTSSGLGAPKLVPSRAAAAERLDEAARRVPVDQRAPRHHVVDEAVAVDVLRCARPSARLMKSGDAADRLEGADRAVDAAGKDARRAREEPCRSECVFSSATGATACFVSS